MPIGRKYIKKEKCFFFGTGAWVVGKRRAAFREEVLQERGLVNSWGQDTQF